ncbi:PilN family type IVB pilus formation outer membrane protein [Paraburkholderia sp. SARCC-3016]|uniref:PilN family type IVB pilus formation outer membrane protein n=1 Tax=Paraburkholderia sp. SARCC-3016 TaxID=3058611 RepID=UPI00280A261E|nr:PilN family type IVB pilus formation outer membrane protein [Paraburkholderia sp. SARCC-3016]MDQ7980288.1 PilN family type IVB pilus formation outer membrane protein [Paraburkholderia sp. SARCC-3016]
MIVLSRYILMAVACVPMLAGCTGLMQKVEQGTQGDVVRADKLLGNLGTGNNLEADNDAVVVKDDLWLSGKTIKLSSKSTLPKLFGEPASFDGAVDSLRAFADRISRLAHIPSKIAPGADDAAARATQVSAAALPTGSAAPLPPLPTGLLQGPLPQSAGTGSLASVPAPVPVHIVYSGGTLRGLLDAAAARFGVYWKYEQGAIVFFYTDTRVFQVIAIPGDSRLDTSVVSGASNSGTTSASGGIAGANGAAGGGSGSTSTGSNGTPTVSSDNSANITMNAQLSVYNGLNAAIKSMLSPAGSVVTSPATGSIEVTDTPDVLEHVAEFMDQQNRVLSRQILVNVTVLSVILSADDSYGINWNAVYEALGTKFGITTAFSSLIPNSNELSATVITPSSRANTTSAVINALSTQGAVRRKTSASITTLNDQPVPVQVAEQQGYLAQVSSTSTLNVGTQTSLTPGTITTGFNLTLLPHVLDDGTVMMQFSTNISSLASLVNFQSAGQTIQLPTVDTRNFLQRIAVKSGQTLVISGYEGIADQDNRQGIGTPANFVAGGGVNASHSREVIVILLSPVTMNGA